ncbi:response regulator [Chromatium okenii]|nr:response regulator [Chromatium okenii]
MVIEDDASTGALLVQLVKRLWTNTSVYLASDAASGLEQWRDHGADLILLDWALPGMSGIEILKQIRRADTTVKCVMISGHAERDVILSARAYQVDAFIVKPFNAKQVMARLGEIMALPEPSSPSPATGHFESFEDFIHFQMNKGTLGLPIDPALVNSIEGMRTATAGERVRVLRRCQFHPALVFRLLSLANSGQYVQGMESVETFENAIQAVGLDGFINLAVEMSLHPGSHLRQEFLIAHQNKYQRDGLALAEVIMKLSATLSFSFNAARSACMLYRVGELSLLQVMQAWLDLGYSLSEEDCTATLKAYSAATGNRIKTQWNIPNTIRGRIGAAHLLPSGTVKIDALVMRIAHLLLTNDTQHELPRLVARVGLTETQLDQYRPNAIKDERLNEAVVDDESSAE